MDTFQFLKRIKRFLQLLFNYYSEILRIHFQIFINTWSIIDRTIETTVIYIYIYIIHLSLSAWNVYVYIYYIHTHKVKSTCRFRFESKLEPGPELERVPVGYERRSDGWRCAPGYTGDAKASVQRSFRLFQRRFFVTWPGLVLIFCFFCFLNKQIKQIIVCCLRHFCFRTKYC